MSVKKALIKVSLQGKEEVFLFSEYEAKNNLTLTILDIEQNDSYVGQVSDLDLRTQAARIRLTFSDFIEKVKEALFQMPSTESNFVYSLEAEDTFFMFKWKSVDQEETVINLGCVKMIMQSYVSVFKDVLLSVAKDIFKLNLNIENLTVELAKCKTQTSQALNQLSEAVDVKEHLEKEMYAKFLLVLNEKKRKIKEISQNDISHLKPRSNNHKRAKPNTSNMNRISDSSDEEFNEFLDLNKPGPSACDKRNSLFLDDEDDSIVPVRPNKIRNRNIKIKNTTSENRVIPSSIKTNSKNIIENDSDEFLLDNL